MPSSSDRHTMTAEDKTRETLHEVAQALAIDLGDFRVGVVGVYTAETAEVAFGDFVRWHVEQWSFGASTKERKIPVVRLDGTDAEVLLPRGYHWALEEGVKKWLGRTDRRPLPLELTEGVVICAR